MSYVLIVIAGLWFAMLVSAKALLLTLAGGLLLAAFVSRLASAFAGMPIGMGAALKAVLSSGLLAALASFFLLGSVLAGGGLSTLVLAIPILLVAFTAGFHLTLGTTLPSSIAIAFLSAMLATGLVTVLRTWAM